MGRRHLLYLLYTSSARPPSSSPYFAAPPPPFLIRKRYSQESSRANHGDEIIDHERAPSTLKEFKRMEEEKAHQTVEKEKDGAMEAVTGDDSVDSKESFKEAVGAGKFRKTGD